MVIVLIGLAVGYMVVQARLLYHLGGGWRLAAGVPLAISVPALVTSLVLLGQGSNLWPLPFMAASAVALVGLAIVWALYKGHLPGARRPR